MTNEITLLIMAAGMGSRYGGLKQIEPVGPSGEFIIDYSIYDAIKVGFTKVVFVIKKENEKVFKETIGNRISKYIKVEYAFQYLEDVPASFHIPEGRRKPWGTAHAVYAARNHIHEPFAVINADDFYGRNAYEVMYRFLKKEQTKKTYAIIGYPVENTLSLNGSVKRAVIKEKDGNLISLIESSIDKKENKIYATPLNGGNTFEVSKEDFVCMNMLGFTPDLFQYIEKDFLEFLIKNKTNLLEKEYFIPDVIYNAKQKENIEVCILPTTAKWQGITYKEDKEKVKKEITTLIEKKEYPFCLWKK